MIGTGNARNRKCSEPEVILHKCVRGIWNCLAFVLARRCRLRHVSSPFVYFSSGNFTQHDFSIIKFGGLWLRVPGLELRDLHVMTLLRAGKWWVARSGRTTFSSPTNLTSARLCRTSTSAQSSGSGTGLCCLIKITLRNHEHENLDLLHTMTTLDCPWTYELPSVSVRGTSYPWANRQ